MTQFTINDSNLIDGITRGYGRVEVRVLGYWSDVITLYVNRDNYGGKDWKITLSHSSGGRDTEVVECDLEAEANFAAALLATANFGQTLKARFGEFEEMYQAQREQDRLAREAERLAQQKRVDADAPLGMSAAKVMVFRLANQDSDSRWKFDSVKIVKRGADEDSRTSVLDANIGKKVTYMLNGSRVSRQEAIQVLAESSNRTQYVENV